MAKRQKQEKNAVDEIATDAASRLLALSQIAADEVDGKIKRQSPRAAGEFMRVALFLAEQGVLDKLTCCVHNFAKHCGQSTDGTFQEVANRMDGAREVEQEKKVRKLTLVI